MPIFIPALLPSLIPTFPNHRNAENTVKNPYKEEKF